MTVKDIYEFLAGKAPVDTAMDFDNVGLLVGRQDRTVTRVLAALDITDEVIREAIEAGADLIVSHHPLFFQLRSVSDQSWTGERALALAENRIAAICMHTNLDAAEGGVNDALMNALDARITGVLDVSSGIGRIGELADAVTLCDFLHTVKTTLNTNGLRYHSADRPVHKIAVCGGSGGNELALAHERGCDTYVTADIKYDQFLEARHLGLNLIDADHFCTENVVVPVLHSWLKEQFPGLDVKISTTHGQTAQFF